MPPRGKGKAPPKLSTRDPALERPGTYKLLLLNCPESITTDDVLSYYRQQIGKDVVERVKWFFNRCGMFIGSGFLLPPPSPAPCQPPTYSLHVRVGTRDPQAGSPVSGGASQKFEPVASFSNSSAPAPNWRATLLNDSCDISQGQCQLCQRGGSSGAGAIVASCVHCVSRR